MTDTAKIIEQSNQALSLVKKRKVEAGNGSTSPSPPPDRWDDPDFSILDDRRGKLPGFPILTLSTNSQQFVVKAAHGAGVRLDHVAVPLLGIVSSLIGTARRVRASNTWNVPLTCWVSVVGFSGAGKTPGLDTIRESLSKIQ